MLERRVVITGIGIVSPLANGREATWERLIAGKSGAGRIDAFDPEDMPCKIAFQVPWVSGRGGGEGDPHAFDPNQYVTPKEMRRIDEFILYAIAAAEEAVEDSDWKPEDDEGQERTGVLIGSGIGGLESIYETAVTLHEHGPRKVSPFFIPSALINLASGQVSIRHKFKGPNHSVVTACATGAHAIGDSARLIKYGDADVMLAGGAEAVIGRIGIAGFCAAKAMSTNFNDTPEKASRPYDSLGAACNHDIRITIFDEAGRVADRVSAGSTGRHHRMVGPFEFVPDRYLARGQIDQSSRDEERAHLARPALMKRDRSLVDRLKTTNTGPDENASALLTFVILGLPSGILYSFVCCSDRIKNELVDPAHLFRRYEFSRIKRMGVSFAATAACYPRNLKRNLARHVLRIERINTSGSRLAFNQALPGCLTASGQWRDNPDSGNNNAAV